MDARQHFLADVALDKESAHIEEFVVKSSKTSGEIYERTLEYMHMFLTPFSVSNVKRHLNKYPEHMPQAQAKVMKDLFDRMAAPTSEEGYTTLLAQLRKCRQLVLRSVTSPSRKAFLGDDKRMDDKSLQMYSVLNPAFSDIKDEVMQVVANTVIRKAKVAVSVEDDATAAPTEQELHDYKEKEKERQDLLRDMKTRLQMDSMRPVQRSMMINSICDVLGGARKSEMTVELCTRTEDTLATDAFNDTQVVEAVENIMMQNDTDPDRKAIRKLSRTIQHEVSASGQCKHCTFRMPASWSVNQMELYSGKDDRFLAVPLCILRNYILNEGAQCIIKDDMDVGKIKEAVLSNIESVDKVVKLLANIGVVGPAGIRSVVLRFWNDEDYSHVNSMIMEFSKTGKPQPIILMRKGKLKDLLKKHPFSMIDDNLVIEQPPFNPSLASIQGALRVNKFGRKKKKATVPSIQRQREAAVDPPSDCDEMLA